MSTNCKKYIVPIAHDNAVLSYFIKRTEPKDSQFTVIEYWEKKQKENIYLRSWNQ